MKKSWRSYCPTGAANLLEERASASQVRSTKPAPDVVQAALALLELSPSEAALGDTPYDRDAANSAGVDFVGLRCGGWRGQDLVNAIAIYDDPSDLLEHFVTSPFAAIA